MRGNLISLALCCLIYRAYSSTLINSYTDGPKAFYVYEVKDIDSSLDISRSDPCPDGRHLAVFENEDEYGGLMKGLMAEDSALVNGRYWFGLTAAPNDYVMRTPGGRMAHLVNYFYDDATTDKTMADQRCGVMEFNKDSTETRYINFLQSPWTLGGCIVRSPTRQVAGVKEYFVCQNSVDIACTYDCDRPPSNDRRAHIPVCKWKLDRKEKKMFTWMEAKHYCGAYGGHLLNLRDRADILYIKTETEDNQPWNNYWLGGQLEPGHSCPRWYLPDKNDGPDDIDEMDAWVKKPMYGSGYSYTPYATMWNVGKKGMNLYNTVYHTEGNGMARDGKCIPRTAYAFCEATQENYCMARMPDMPHAEKRMEGHKALYTCKDGYEFADGTKRKELTCNCDTNFEEMETLSPCIVSNPCMKDANTCGVNGYCIFTSEPAKPYYCLCKKGYKYDEVRKVCVDIDECAEHNKCGEYNGKCINTDGDFMCQCEQGMNWNNGKCVAEAKSSMAYVDALTVHFYVNMPYNMEMNEAQTEQHKKMKEELEMMVKGAFENDYGLKLADFHAKSDNGMTKVELLLGLQLKGDTSMVSTYAYKFSSYVKSRVYFKMGRDTFPIDGVVSVSSNQFKNEIKIHTPCSIFDNLETCHTGHCESDTMYKPMCKCPEGTYGPYCESKIGVTLTDTEIILIVVIGCLFLLVCLMPVFMWCCYAHCIRRYKAAAKVLKLPEEPVMEKPSALTPC